MNKTRILPNDRYQRLIFLFFVACFAASCISPPYVEFLLMQHVPTVLAGCLLGWLSNRWVISRLSFTAIILFLLLHTIGARYLYSYTPYDTWSRYVFGIGVNELFGFERNHYDRLVHFSFGLLVAVPIQEVERRYLGLSVMVSSLLAIECIIATSACYELIEWFVAIVFTPDWADQFLGQQGDTFDAQKDMALATSGAIISVALSVAVQRRNFYRARQTTASS
jgi:putative membrane protein